MMLVDTFGRTVNYLRMSVTDRCDFRCVYCMAEHMQFMPRQQLLTLEELFKLGQVFVSLGVKKIRISGGEPLIRCNVGSLLNALGTLRSEGLKELTLTTNGSQLRHYAQAIHAAGIRRINVSLDSLQPKRFRALTRTGDLKQVLGGIAAAQKLGIQVKINSVMMRNRNVDELIDLVQFAQSQSMDISFIEEMPLGHIVAHQRQEEFVSSAELRAMLSDVMSLQPVALNSGRQQDVCDGPSRYWRVGRSATRVGFISPHSENFCSQCNRVRLTADGRLLLCLGNEHSVDLKALIRNTSAPKDALRQAIAESMSIKPEKHEFSLDEPPQIVRFMNSTGG